MKNSSLLKLFAMALLLFMAATVAQDGYAQTIRNSSNSTVGKIESDGTIRNSSNSYMGKVEQDGTVRNSSNSTIGYARGVPMRYAALYFFFNLL